MPVRPRECVARVTATRVLTPDVLEADLAMVEPATLAFDAGQWVSVPFGPKTVRAYSIASSPRAPALITLCADVAPGGIFGEHCNVTPEVTCDPSDAAELRSGRQTRRHLGEALEVSFHELVERTRVRG